MIAVAGIDASVTVTLSFAFIWYWGIVGGAVATVIAASAAAIASFTIGFSQFGLRLPLGHLIRIAIATIAMGCLLRLMPEAKNIAAMAAHILTGGTSYIAALALLYAPTLFKMLRARPQQSSP